MQMEWIGSFFSSFNFPSLSFLTTYLSSAISALFSLSLSLSVLSFEGEGQGQVLPHALCSHTTIQYISIIEES